MTRMFPGYSSDDDGITVHHLSVDVLHEGEIKEVKGGNEDHAAKILCLLASYWLKVAMFPRH